MDYIKSELELDLERYAIGRTIRMPSPGVFLTVSISRAGQIFFGYASMVSPSDVVLGCFCDLEEAKGAAAFWRQSVGVWDTTIDADQHRLIIDSHIEAVVMVNDCADLFRKMNR